MNYTKKQTGWIFLLIIFIVLIAFAIPLFCELENIVVNQHASISVIIGCLFAIILFYQLKVTVRKNTMVLTYGIGIIQFTKDLEELKSVEVIKKPWYYGNLIRVTPQGTLYNIRGSKAVKITVGSGDDERKFLVGTPEPEILKKAIEENLDKS